MTLITGFGPFGEFAVNPSQVLAERSGLPYRVIPVSFAAADSLVRELAHNPPRRLLLMGLHGKAQRLHIELVAHNRIGGTPDNDGEIAGPGPIDPSAPQHLGTTLWRHPQFYAEYSEWTISLDAGGYLCNYVYFRALQWLPETQVGFLHVPTFEIVSEPFQQSLVSGILEYLEEDAVGFSASSNASDTVATG